MMGSMKRMELEALSTEKLEQMVREDIEGGRDYDPEMICEILDILVERDAPDVDLRWQSTEMSWRRFRASQQSAPYVPSPGGRECPVNGEWPGYECCCDECDYAMECYPMPVMMSEDELIDVVSRRILDKYREAFEELAKGPAPEPPRYSSFQSLIETAWSEKAALGLLAFAPELTEEQALAIAQVLVQTVDFEDPEIVKTDPGDLAVKFYKLRLVDIDAP